MKGLSVQDEYAPKSICFGCGPANEKGLKIKSYRKEEGLEMEFETSKEHMAFEGVINGGIISVDQIKNHLSKVNGVMMGRSIYHSPYILADIEKEIFNNDDILTRQEVIEKLIPYVKNEIKNGTRMNQIMRHTLGLFHGQTGSSFWKRYLSENMCVRDADIQKVDHIMDKIKLNNVVQSAGQID